MQLAGMAELARRVTAALDARQRVCLASVVDSRLPHLPPGTTWAFLAEEAWRFSPYALDDARPSSAAPDAHPSRSPPPPPPGLDAALADAARRLLGKSAHRAPGRAAAPRDRMAHFWWPAPPGSAQPPEVRVFLEVLEPPPRLVVFGAGQDAAPLCRIGAEAGFEVLVADPRPAFAVPERLPGCREVRCSDPDGLPPQWFAGDCYAVVMNHHFLRDAAALRVLVEHGVPYVGVLGPGARTRRLLARVEQELGRTLTPQERERVYSPVGLDIGGDTPGAVALSVVAEVMAFRWGRAAPHLRARQGPLHPDRLEAARCAPEDTP